VTAPLGVLCSGGLDSVVLVAHEAQSGPVQPIYVSVGLAWEGVERGVMRAVLAALPGAGRVAPAASLRFAMDDIYPTGHWAVRGEPPGYDTPDAAVYLAGRNLSLLAKAGTYCARHGIARLAVGTLAGNPFPDATPTFFAAMGRALSLGLAAPIEIAAPFADLRKADVIRLGMSLGIPLELTLSCMHPQGGRHCGRCSKCRERQHAFREAAVPDLTSYAVGR
jgi:7-cyano-7-deazaguanine synthase